MDTYVGTGRVRSLLIGLFAKRAPDSAFAFSLRERVEERAAQFAAETAVSRRAAVRAVTDEAQALRTLGRWRRLLPRGVAVLAVALIAVSLQPVRAAVLRLFGYGHVPEAGFVDLSDTLVLQGRAAQVGDECTLIVTQVAAASDGTRIWFRFQGQGPDGVCGAASLQPSEIRLETEDGLKLAPWTWSVPRSGEEVGYAGFGSLPAGVTSAVLVLAPDWELPLQLEPAAESAGASSTVVYPDTCVNRSGFELCVLAAASDETAMHVLLGAEAVDPALRISSRTLVAVGPLTGENTVLLDNHGQTLASLGVAEAAVPWASPPDGLPDASETMHFEHLSADASWVILRVPATMAEAAVGAAFEVDVGSDPRPGDRVEIDAAIDVAGQVVWFRQAEVLENADGVQVLLASEPLSGMDDRLVIGLNALVSPGVRLVGSGFEASSRVVKLWFSVDDGQGRVRGGSYRVGVESAQLVVLGPFEFSWAMPSQP